MAVAVLFLQLDQRMAAITLARPGDVKRRIHLGMIILFCRLVKCDSRFRRLVFVVIVALVFSHSVRQHRPGIRYSRGILAIVDCLGFENCISIGRKCVAFAVFDISRVVVAAEQAGSCTLLAKLSPPGLLPLADFREVLFEPKQPHHDNENVDEAEVGQDRDKVDVELLVEVEELDVNAASLLAHTTPMEPTF